MIYSMQGEAVDYEFTWLKLWSSCEKGVAIYEWEVGPVMKGDKCAKT